MADISGYGLQVRLIASITFPVGMSLTEFADDADPFDLPSLQIRDKAMGLNGDLLVWSKANPINLTINVIPDGVDDTNLAILFESNRVGRGKLNVRDIITLTGIYPDGAIIQLNNGYITDGIPANSVASAGRLKTKPYMFTFQNLTRT